MSIKYKKISMLLLLTLALISAVSVELDEGGEESMLDYYQDSRANFPRDVEPVNDLPDREDLFVFIMAGQSNMAGRGFVEPEDTIPHKRIITISESMSWVYAKEPLHFYEPKLTGLDCGMSFARTLLDSLPAKITIAMIPCAVGGSSIDKWLANESHRGVQLMDNFKDKVEFVKQYGTIKGIIWHQGESNASTNSIKTYETKLTRLITTFREVVGDDTLPFIAGELGRYTEPPEKQERWNSLNDVIHKVVDYEGYAGVVTSQGLTDKGDKTHLDSESQRELGKRYANKYLELSRP